MRRAVIAAVLTAALGLGAIIIGSNRTEAQSGMPGATPSEARDALQRAESDRRAADLRATTLEDQAAQAGQAAAKASREGAALAARIQQAEAAITAAEIRAALIQDQQAALDLRLADRREPLMRLTAALQRLARRPLALSALRPGSLKDAVYLRAMLATTVPQVERRTQSLRAELDRSRELVGQARSALADLRDTEEALAERRRRLAAFETRQRLASRQASVAARREEERAFALAEEARDLDALVDELDRAGALRTELAALSGPVLRPARPARDTVQGASSSSRQASSTAAPQDYRMPVAGRILAGFGERVEGGLRREGLLIAPRGEAVVVAPAQGRIAFAGPYRGYGSIVIIEHGNGWTSLLTGLARVDAAVGEELIGGAPLGRASAGDPRINLELRRAGAPVNPLRLIG